MGCDPRTTGAKKKNLASGGTRSLLSILFAFRHPITPSSGRVRLSSLLPREHGDENSPRGRPNPPAPPPGLGVARWTAKSGSTHTYSGLEGTEDGSSSQSNSGYDPIYGVDLRYGLGGGWGIGLSLGRIRMTEGAGEWKDVDESGTLVSIGLTAAGGGARAAVIETLPCLRDPRRRTQESAFDRRRQAASRDVRGIRG